MAVRLLRHSAKGRSRDVPRTAATRQKDYMDYRSVDSHDRAATRLSAVADNEKIGFFAVVAALLMS